MCTNHAVFRNEPGDEHLGSVSALITQAFELGDDESKTA